MENNIFSTSLTLDLEQFKTFQKVAKVNYSDSSKELRKFMKIFNEKNRQSTIKIDTTPREIGLFDVVLKKKSLKFHREDFRLFKEICNQIESDASKEVRKFISSYLKKNKQIVEHLSINS